MRTKEELMERAYKVDEIKHIDCSEEEMFVVAKGVDVELPQAVEMLAKKTRSSIEDKWTNPELNQTNFRFQKIGVA